MKNITHCPVIKNYLLILVLINIIICPSIPALAKLPPKQIDFVHITTKDGLANPVVMGIAQDKQGFMWFATANGLSRYDGYTFKNYMFNPDNPDDPNTVSGEVIVDIIVDSSGLLWLTVYGGGLNIYDPDKDRFTHLKHDPKNPDSISSDIVIFVCEDRNRDIWTSTLKHGLNRYDRKNMRFVRYLHEPGNPDSIASNETHSVFEDQKGRIWVGVLNGIDRLDKDRKTFVHYTYDKDNLSALPKSARWRIGEDRSGNIWACGTDGGGLLRYDETKDRFIRYVNDPDDPASLLSNNIWNIFEDSKGTLWVTSLDAGVDVYNREKDSFINYRYDPDNPMSLINNNVYQVFEDRSQVLWFSTFGGGVCRYDRKIERFGRIKHEPLDSNSLVSNDIAGIYEDSSGILWIGTNDKGLNRFNPETGEYTLFYPDPANPAGINSKTICSISGDDNNLLWIGTLDGGLNSYNPGSGKFSHYMFKPDDHSSILENRCYKVLYAGNNELWISHQAGVSKMDVISGKFTRYPGVGNFNNVLFKDSRGNIWVGGASGFYLYDPNKDRFSDKALTTGVAEAMTEDSDGNLWLRWGGIRKYEWEKRKFTEHYTVKHGLIDNSIIGMLTDNSDRIWIATKKGLSRFDPREKQFKNYEIGTFNLGSNFKSKTGRLYFGGIQGLTHFNPDEIMDNPHKPPVVLTSFKKFNKEALLDTPVNRLKELKLLQHKDQFISFEFAGLDYSDPGKNLYKYMLEGFDREWVQVESSRRFASYTNLDEGLYRFRVTASNNNGVWNEKGLSLNVLVEPDLQIESTVIKYKNLESGEIRLPFKNNSLFLEIAPADFNILGKKRSYMLEGYDDNWIPAKNRRYVNYSHLNPGRYIFKTRGNPEYKATITIAAPFWKTWWFNLAIIVSIFLLIAAAYKIRLNNIEEQRSLLEKQVEIRTAQLKASRQAAEAANLAKSEFLTNMSHEIRTPMNSILGFSEILLSRNRDEKEKSYLETIQSSGQILLSLINDILDLSKIEAGKTELRYKPVNLDLILKEIQNIFVLKADDKAIKFLITTDSELPEIIFDEIRLRQILINIVGNAIKFTEQGYVKISVRLDRDGKNELLTLYIQVEDTGIGIHEKEQKLIFNSFEQQKGQDNAKYGGTGLGLAISKKLVELMDGTISVRSEPGKGSVFKIIFPGIKPLVQNNSIPARTAENYPENKNIVSGRASILNAGNNKKHANPSIPEGLKSRLGELLHLMETRLFPRWEKINEIFGLDNIDDFVEELDLIVKEYEIELLRNYAGTLGTANEQVDIENIEKLLKEFPEIFDALTNVHENSFNLINNE